MTEAKLALVLTELLESVLTKMEDLKNYNFSVAWSAEDEAFIARTTEVPDIIAHGDSPEESLRELCFALIPIEEPANVR